MLQPSFIPKSGSDVCVTATGSLDDDLYGPKTSNAPCDDAPGAPGDVAPDDPALSALLSLSSSRARTAEADENADGNASFDDRLVARVAASNKARQSDLMRAAALMPPPPPLAAPLVVTVKDPRPRPEPRGAAAAGKRGDLVARCARFTAALKEAHPPGSPVFTLFRAFVTHGRDDVERRQVILELVALLKPDPRLLRLFYGLLPSWVFKRPSKAAC